MKKSNKQPKQSLKEAFPDLCKEWDYEKNTKTPDDFSMGSSAKVWWKCEKGHEWEAMISDRVRGRNCPYCSNRWVKVGENDLTTTHPELAKEWHPTKNGSMTPQDFTYGVNRIKVWWLCPNCGNEYPAAILSRTRGQGCPICGKEKQKKSRIKTMLRDGENSLQVVRPDLAAEWHPTKNGNKRPDQYTSSSSAKIWWMCSRCGYEWESTINQRTNRGRGCRNCNERSTSFSEQAVFYYVKKVFPNASNRYKGFGFELDIFIPEINTAIEYDGGLFSWR